MRRWLIATVLAGVMILGACSLLLPERYAVNGPMLQMMFGRSAKTPGKSLIEQRIQVPDGYAIHFYAGDLADARMLRFTTTGDLLVSKPRSGEIVLLERDDDGDGHPDGRRTLLTGLNGPHGLDVHGPWLYIGESDAIARVRFDPATRTTQGEVERIITGLPGDGNHWKKTVRFGPDGWLYVSVGSSCNVCIEEDERRATLLRFRPDGSQPEIYATGLRNTVGFDWHPVTGQLYGTDNGRDLLGNDFPPCELNAIDRGKFYGWPFANGDRVIDPDLGAGHEAQIATSVPPAHAFRAHNAPLGIVFLKHEKTPADLRGSALVALHGSWNRTRKDGYKVVSLHWGDDGEIEERDFVSGFERDENVMGRPVDIAQGPDGSIYISDDFMGGIWRVTHGEDSSVDPDARPALRAASPPPKPVPADPEQVARGQALYEANQCASCHEKSRASEGVVAHPLRNLAQRYSAQDLAAVLAAPPAAMPVLPLTPAERADLAAYLLQMPPAPSHP